MASIKGIFLVVVLMTYGWSSFAQVNRYVVLFNDKANSSFSTDRPDEFLSERAIDRRVSQGINVDESDLPVNETYIAGLQSIGMQTYHTTKWMNGVLVEATQEQVTEAEGLSFVKEVDYVAPGSKLSEFVDDDPGLGPFLSPNESSRTTDDQLRQLHIEEMHRDGYTGDGIMIAVTDGGFLGANQSIVFQHFQENDLLVYTRDLVLNRSNVYLKSSHGTEVLSAIAGKYGEQFTGTAYDARILLFRTEDTDSEYRIEEYNWLFAAEIADSIGVDIINASLGYRDFDDPDMTYEFSELNGTTAVISRAHDMAYSKGIIPVTSAGNTSSNVTMPADAFNVLAVGGVRTDGSKTLSSAYFDTEDGRIKPDVVALGNSVTTLKSSGNFGGSTGTSFASPLIAGFAAGIWQAYPEATNAQIMQMIRNSGSSAEQISDLLGYGIPSYLSIIGKELTDIEETPDKRISIFPNPSFDGLFYISVSGERTFDMIVYVRDLSGKLLNVFYFDEESQLTLDISGLPHATYLVTVDTGKGLFNQKVVKQ